MTDNLTDKPTGQFVCLVCGREWDGSQLYQNPQSTAAHWTCGDLFCGGSVTKISADRIICPECGADIPNDGNCWYCENMPTGEES